MTDNPDVISGDFSDFKLVRTRGVAQLVIEIPIERAKHALDLLGIPESGKSTSVAVARIKSVEKWPQNQILIPKVKTPFSELPPSQQAGILCDDTSFIEWSLGAGRWADLPVDSWVRTYCGVTSRKELDQGDHAASPWKMLLAEYQRDRGLIAEDRS